MNYHRMNTLEFKYTPEGAGKYAKSFNSLLSYGKEKQCR